jgi:cyclic-di-AMP phosphodiesterase PgpH
MRAQLRPPSDGADMRQARLARQRRRWARLGIVALAIVATTAIVYGGGPPFAYRVGQRPSRDIRVRVLEFRHPNPVKTNALREEAARQVPPILSNDPAPLRELESQLEDLIDGVALAAKPNLDELAPELLKSWGLDQKTFDDIRAASDTPERRDELRRRIGKAFEPLIRNGVLTPGTLALEDEPGPLLDIRSEGISSLVPRDRVIPERVSRPDGPAAEAFQEEFVPADLGRGLFRLIAPRLSALPTLRYEADATSTSRQAARDRVSEYDDSYKRGELLVEQGQPINEDQLELLALEHQEAEHERGLDDRLKRAVGILILVSALFSLLGAYILRFEGRLAENPSRLAVLCGLAIVSVGLARLLAIKPWGAELVPIALAAMTLAVAYNPLFALMVSFGLCVLVSMATGGGLATFLILMGGTATGALILKQVRTRTKPIQVGAAAALGYSLLTLATGLWQDQPLALIASESAWRAGWGLLSGFLLGGSLPFVEKAFGIVTGMSLLELGDVTHPLLQELVRRAPGTHNHSITVGAIAESAAEKVGADALLVRIGAYFHDIGKMLKPHYFIENQTAGINRHANLAPAMSTLIIIGHVKDGSDLARQHHLPEPLIDLIEQHHGTTLVEYFYHEANRRRDRDPDASEILESAFRYPGPKPQSKEAAILMIADAVESASRTLSDPTPGRIEGLVSELTDKRLRDGQFDECDLTLQEIAMIRESLIKSLIGIYHGRIKYPEQRTA